MPKFMVQASYTASGIKGLLEEGGTARKAVVEEMARQVGGTVEAVYFAFGKSDIYAILDLPDNASMAALSLTTGATGAISSRTVVLLTPEEIDAAARKHLDFRPPGA